MKHTLALTITSLLSILFVTFHFTSDTLHAKVGTPEAGGVTLVVVAHTGRLAVRNARARRATFRVRHHARRGTPCPVPSRHPRDGSGRRFSRNDRQVQRSIPFRLDASRPRRDGDVFRHSCGTWTMESATGSAPVTLGQGSCRPSLRLRPTCPVGIQHPGNHAPHRTQTQRRYIQRKFENVTDRLTGLEATPIDDTLDRADDADDVEVHLNRGYRCGVGVADAQRRRIELRMTAGDFDVRAGRLRRRTRRRPQR